MDTSAKQTVKPTKAVASLKELAGDSKLLEGLNPEQLKAVTHGEGPLLILAGAGTGKTAVITRRIAWLIEQDKAEPDEILALTFTEKAAAEMQGRLFDLGLGQVPEHISTFHSFGDSLIKEFSYELGLPPDAPIMGSAEQVIFLEEFLFDQLPLKKLKPSGRPAKFLAGLARTFSRAKNEGISPEQYADWVKRETASVKQETDPELKLQRSYDLEIQSEIAAAFQVYENLKRERHRIDFADQVYLPLKLLKENEAICQRVAKRFKYLLVDEFQDTNVIQSALVNQLAGPGGNLTVVGDDDQSIFGFQGAAIENILEFGKNHRDPARVVLTTNYRSTQPILDAAHDAVAKNSGRLEEIDQLDKRLKADRGEGQAVVFDPAGTVDDEAEAAAAYFEQRHAEVPWQEMAILVRTKSMIEPFAQALRARGIPYIAEGTGKLFDRPEVKMVVSFVRAITDPLDSANLHYLITGPAYEFPQDHFFTLAERMRRTHQPLWELLGEIAESGEEGAGLAGRIREDITRYAETGRDLDVARTTYAWLEHVGYTRRLKSPEEEVAARNLVRLFDRLKQFVRVAADPTPAGWVSHFEDIIALEDESVATETDDYFEAVRIMTIHASKGLEFEIVRVVGLVARKFPGDFRRDAISPAPLLGHPPTKERHQQEERRLFYVAMTRAKSELILSAASDYRTKRPWRLSEFVTDVVGPDAAAAMQTKPIDPSAQLAQSRPLPVLASGWKPPERVELSHTALESYRTCPLKYYWEYVIGLRETPNHNLQYGTALHEVIQQINLAKAHGQTPELAEVREWLEAAWQSEHWLSAAHEQEGKERARQTVARFLKEEQTREAPTAVEEAFSFAVEGAVVSGKYDRIDRHHGAVTIVDYKTGQMDSQEKADKRVKTDRQLTIYALAHREQVGSLPDQVVFNFVDSGISAVGTRTDKQVDKMREEIEEIAGRIKAGDFTPNPAQHQCSPFADCPGHYAPHRTQER
jgi:DNA helicase-2/ATP-dependent DNA helicase PcrA